jgi:hypothetical protein
MRFHLHLRCDDLLTAPDEEGADFAGLEDAYLEAFASAQELWPNLLKDRCDPRRYAYDITDAAGVALMELRFTELLDTCHQARRAAPPTARQAKEAFRKAIEDAAEIRRQTAVLSQDLRAAHQRVEELRNVLGSLRGGGPPSRPVNPRPR